MGLFFSFFLFFSIGMSRRHAGGFCGGALWGPYRLSDTCYGIATGKMDKSTEKGDEWCLDHWTAKETAETTVSD